MRIEIHTNAATALWNKIKNAINDEEIKTWSIVKDSSSNEYLTHNPPQWFKKALLEHSILTTPNRLKLNVTWFKGDVPNEYTKGLYIGRITEELLEHFKSDFSKLETFG